MKNELVRLQEVSKSFAVKYNFFGRPQNFVQAVKNISIDIYKGETLGLVGESGCGKTTVGRTVAGLYKPTGGKVLFAGCDVHETLKKDKKAAIRRKMQMIFQDPYASLNPRITVGEIVGEPLDIYNIATGKERKERVQALLQQVGLNPEHANRFPHEFSGGQRQRIGFARALAVMPEFVVCDEPISALDVSIQAQVVNLLQKLQEKLGLTYLFIAHDLSMVKHISRRVAVMYLGSLVEVADCEELYKRPLHPYTKALLSAIPIPDPQTESKRKRILLEGELPSPLNPPSGCRFRTRCSFVLPCCSEEEPELRDVGDGHFVACNLSN